MFVCLRRMGVLCFSLIGLTSDVVCVRVYYTGCVVISNLEPSPPPPHNPPPQSLSHSSPPLHLPEGLLSLHAISQHPTHKDFLMDTHTETHTLTYASAHASKQSYPMCLLRCDGMPEETFHPSICTSLSVQFFQVWRGHRRQRAYNQLN